MGLTVERVRSGYAVFDGDRRVSDVRHSLARTEELRDQMARGANPRLAVDPYTQARPQPEVKPKERKCMCCANRFMSEGPHHRMCLYCRQRVGGLDRNMVGA